MQVNNRFAYLDGIRGIAAIFVLTRHTGEFWNFFLYRSYLSVDLFFILSGFVISYAYDKKLANNFLSIREFFIIRMIRLYPVYLLSVLLCGMIILSQLFTKNSSDTSNIISSQSYLLSLLLLPSIVAGSTSLFPVNGVYWSLFFEIIANVIYAAVRPLLKTWVLLGIVIFFGIIVVLGVLVHGNLDIGYDWSLKSISIGFSRAMFGVFLGLLLQRHFIYLSELLYKISPWIAALTIALILASPSMGRLNRLIDILAVIVIFPVCVIWAAQGTSNKMMRILLTLGSASYPIYVLHVPAERLVSQISKDFATLYAPISGIIFLMILIWFAIWMEKIYDIPFRRWLTRKWMSSRP